MPIARASILRGPCMITYNGEDFFSQGDVTIALRRDTFEVADSAHGKLDERVTERMAEVSFTPSGVWDALTVLFPYATMVIGDSIFGADTPLVIQSTVDGRTVTFAAAAVTKMPDIVVGATKTAFGSMTFSCLGTDNAAWTAADSLFGTASGTFTDPGAGTISTKSPAITWASPLTGVNTTEGVAISFNLSTDRVGVDSEGTVDYTFVKLDVSARFRPVGITEAQLATAMKIQDTGAVIRGGSLSAAGNDLVIAAAPISVTLKTASIKNAGLAYGPATLNIGELEFIATKTGVNPLFAVASI